jgi:polyhydroxybutyrate depolymerase
MKFSSRIGVCLVCSIGPALIAHCGVQEPSDLGELARKDAGVFVDGSVGIDPGQVESPDSGQDAGQNVSFVSEDGGDGDGATGDSGQASGGECGTRSGMRGKTLRMATVGGQARTYIAYLPSSLSPTEPAPLVYAFHGASMNGADMYDVTQYAPLADSEGIAVVFPDGQGASSAADAGVFDPWNVSDSGVAVCGGGNYSNNPTPDVDFEFMDAIKADIMQDQCVDLTHVFATGFSMGGYFSHHIGCERPDVRAVAPHSGGTIADLSQCKTGHEPIIIFHGTADRSISDGCDDPNGTAQSGFMPSATLWAQKNGCQTTSTASMEQVENGQCYLYDGCPADGQVELCTFNGMGHCWAGGSTAGLYPMGACPDYGSALHLEWAFWKKYAW